MDALEVTELNQVLYPRSRCVSKDVGERWKERSRGGKRCCRDKKQLVLCRSLVAEVNLCCMRNLEVNRAVILKSLNKVFSVYEEEHF